MDILPPDCSGTLGELYQRAIAESGACLSVYLPEQSQYLPREMQTSRAKDVIFIGLSVQHARGAVALPVRALKSDAVSDSVCGCVAKELMRAIFLLGQVFIIL